MKNFVEKGNVLNYPIPADTAIVSGDVVSVGTMIGIAGKSSSTEGEIIPVNLCGVFELAKKAPLVITQGDRLYWDSDPGEITKTVTDKPIGTAFESALSADTTVLVRLYEDGVPSAQAAVVAALTDNSGGEAGDGTIAVLVDAGGTAAGAPTTASVANAIKELSTKQNAILTALKNAGLMASA